MSEQKAAGDPAFLKQQRKRLTAMRDQLRTTGTARNASERVPKAGEAKEIEDDAQDLAQGEVDGTIDAVEEQRLRSIERALAKIEEGTYGLSDLSGDPYQSPAQPCRRLPLRFRRRKHERGCNGDSPR
jgi:DnaK suppressor protein